MFFKNSMERKKISLRVYLFLMVGCLPCILGGCINLPKGTEKSKLFYLKALPFSEQEKKALPVIEWQLTIEEPSCDIRLDADRFVVQKSFAELTYVTGVRWADRLPRLVQQFLLNMFENSGKIEGVGLPIEGLEADYVLLIDIRDFDLVVSQTKEVKIRLFAKMMRLKDREIVGARIFEKSISVKEDVLMEVVQAFLQGMNEVGKEIVVWTLAFKE